MNYEKKYKEAMDRMELCVRSGLKITPEYIFPELAESEDEKVRKEIVGFLDMFLGTHITPTATPKQLKGWIAWLEKQGQVKESTVSQHENRTCKENDDSLTYNDERIRAEENKGNIGGISAEWSENDKAFLDDILCKLEHDLTLNKDEKDWLKSLKGRVKPQWKPSDEQMELLSEVQSALLGKDCHNRFTGFMWELKELKEEQV